MCIQFMCALFLVVQVFVVCQSAGQRFQVGLCSECNTFLHTASVAVIVVTGLLKVGCVVKFPRVLTTEVHLRNVR